jgi:hypothetical protein
MMICREGLATKMIELDLRRHCIQTETKKLYNQCIAQYFNSGLDKKQLEARIKILKTIMERCDFPRLRSRYPELAGNREDEVALALDEQDRIVILINGKEVDPFCS